MKKKVLIALGVILVLAAIGGTLPENESKSANAGSSTQNASETQKDDSAAQKAEDKTPEETGPKASIDTLLDDIKVDSYTVDESGVTLNLSFDSSESDYVSCDISRFEYAGKKVYMGYDSEQDKYSAPGIKFEENGKASDWGGVQLQGGSKTTVKFSVDDFDKAQDYDGFDIYFNLKYSGSWSGEMKDDYVKVHVS